MTVLRAVVQAAPGLGPTLAAVVVVEVDVGVVVLGVDVVGVVVEVLPPVVGLPVAEQTVSAAVRSAAAVWLSRSAFCWALTTACWAPCKAAVLPDVEAAVRTKALPPEYAKGVAAAEPVPEETVVVCPASSAESFAWSALRELCAAVTASWRVLGSSEARSWPALTR
jgi:hypothetical protein